MRFAILFVAVIVLTGCNDNVKNKEKVQEAILNRLQTVAGLDLKTMDIATTSVSFKKNTAYATVAFHPKGDSSVKGGMVMTYTLENRDGKWVVVNVGDSQGHSLVGHVGARAEQLPPGHPPINSAEPEQMNPHTGQQTDNGQRR